MGCAITLHRKSMKQVTIRRRLKVKRLCLFVWDVFPILKCSVYGYLKYLSLKFFVLERTSVYQHEIRSLCKKGHGDPPRVDLFLLICCFHLSFDKMKSLSFSSQFCCTACKSPKQKLCRLSCLSVKTLHEIQQV